MSDECVPVAVCVVCGEVPEHLFADGLGNVFCARHASPLSAAQAEQLLDRILTARQRLERIKAACAETIRVAEADVAEAEQGLPALAAWATANPPTKGKMIRLPVGQMGWRKVPGGPRVVDEVRVLDWARAALPAAVRVVESLDRTTIREYVTTTGELPPGVELQPDEERFGVRP